MIHNMEKETIVVNLMGNPGAGKSTIMAQIFQKLKWMNIDCEMSPEFAKKLVWENRNETLSDQLYIFAKQNHQLVVLNSKVDVIITDSPLILSTVYHRVHHKDEPDYILETLVESTFNSYNNINFLLKRTKPYNPNGRMQTENDSNLLYDDIKNVLDEHNIDYTQLDANDQTCDIIVNEIIENLKHNI